MRLHIHAGHGFGWLGLVLVAVVVASVLGLISAQEETPSTAEIPPWGVANPQGLTQPVRGLAYPTAADGAAEMPTDAVLIHQARMMIGELPAQMPGAENDTPSEIALGERLYFETGMSVTGTQSCNSCHRVNDFGGGVDNTPTSEGALGQFGGRNAPTVLDAGYQVAQFWDGRSPDLADQAKGPILNPIEMGMPQADEVMGRLVEIEGYDYRAAFAEAYPDGEDAFNYDNLGEAIAAFERTLRTHNRVDDYMAGNAEALTTWEKEGLDTFLNVGCVRCHGGPVMGGQLYQRIGIHNAYATEDIGRMEVTGREADRYVFKVPMLRNIAITAPYYHDGSVGTLPEAIDMMAYLQLDIALSPEQIDRLLRFFVAATDTARMTGGDALADIDADAWWEPPSLDDLPQGQDAESALIRYGYDLVTRTYDLLGPGAPSDAMCYTGNALNCSSCHQESGTKRFGIPWVSMTTRYPRYRGRENRIATLADRINGCFERSMNGRRLDDDSREMRAIIAYMGWLSQDAPERVVGISRGTLNVLPERAADLENGESVYRWACQTCHDMAGAGYRPVASGTEGRPVVPPVWGTGTFNNGAGMHRLMTAAAFVKYNMPLGTPWVAPMLTDEQAYDVAAYFNSFSRPIKPNLDADYPELWRKPADCPYPPYADGFTWEQHLRGPFQPILERLEELRREHE